MDDYDALSQKQLASLKRDTRISLEDAAVRATHKVMDEKVIMVRYDKLMQAIKEIRPAAVVTKDKPGTWWLDRFEEVVNDLKEKP